MIIYLIFLIIVIYLIIRAYIKIRYRFWSLQPAFHIYDVLYWIKPPGIIRHDMPIHNRYVNTKNIMTYNINEMSNKIKVEFTKFIQQNYLNQKNAKYFPKENNIFPYFDNLECDSYLSLYYGNDDIAVKDELISVITSRPITIELRNKKITTFLVDFMCVSKEYRRKGLAEQMIQTHLYQQVKQQPNIKTCFFKRETNLTLIIPLVIFNAYCYDITKWNLKKMHSMYDVLKITRQSINIFIHFLSENKKKFDCFVSPTYSNLISLIESENYILYVVLNQKKIVACYIFKQETVSYNEKNAINCIGSIKGNCNSDTFAFGFSHVLLLLTYDILIIENLADNQIIIDNISLKYKPNFLTPIAYYFHNYADRPVEKEKTLLFI